MPFKYFELKWWLQPTFRGNFFCECRSIRSVDERRLHDETMRKTYRAAALSIRPDFGFYQDGDDSRGWWTVIGASSVVSSRGTKNGPGVIDGLRSGARIRRGA